MKSVTFDDDKYALVPIEPTKEMRRAAINEQHEWMKLSLGLQGDEPAAAIYRAMLAASPSAPIAEGDK